MAQWKDVIGFESIYQVDEVGNVRRKSTGRIRKPQFTNDGYKTLILHQNKKKKHFTIHRLVALHFVPNPNNYEFVNHKDLNKTNNHYQNLEWCTHLMNMQHAFANNSRGSGKRFIKSEQNIDRIWNKKYEYDGQSLTVKEWAKVTGLKYRTISSRLLKGWGIEKSLTEPLAGVS